MRLASDQRERQAENIKLFMSETYLATSIGFMGRATLAMAVEQPSGNKTCAKHAARASWPLVAAVVVERCYMEPRDKITCFRLQSLFLISLTTVIFTRSYTTTLSVLAKLLYFYNCSELSKWI